MQVPETIFISDKEDIQKLSKNGMEILPLKLKIIQRP